MAGTSPAMTPSLRRRERQRAGAFEGHVEGDLAGMIAAVFERRDLERTFDAAEIRHDHLIALDRAVENSWRKRVSEASSDHRFRKPLDFSRVAGDPALPSLFDATFYSVQPSVASLNRWPAPSVMDHDRCWSRSRPPT